MFKKKPKKPAPSATKDRSNIYTTGQIGRTRETTPEGYLLCRDVPLARIGTLMYGDGEVPVTADNTGLILIQRGEDVLFDPKTIASAEGKPITDDQRIINLNHEDTHDLFTISDMLISDFSSIIFDYSFFNKPMYFFVPDLDEYLSTLGCFVDYQKIMPGAICLNENQLADAIIVNKQYDIEAFSKIFFKYHDGKNIERVVELIKKVRHE